MENKKTSIYRIIEQIAEREINEQGSDGSFPSGHNGPYNDAETPVRNTSHWLIILLYLYETSGEDELYNSAQDAISYLISEEARPGNATFHHRDVENKDSCNGIMGQAWTIEALVTAARVLQRDDLITIAEEVFLLHPFNETLGLWKQVEIDGSVLGFDSTFNHQLWFAAIGGLLARHKTVSEEIERQVLIFLNGLDKLVDLTSSGLIYHGSVPEFGVRTAIDLASEDKKLFVLSALKWTNLTGNRIINSFFNSQFSPARRAPLSGEEHIYKSVGYHSFNLYALALLYKSYPNHEFWSTETFKRIIAYSKSDDYIQSIDDNKFGYAYNPPGFEVPFALETFCGEESRDQQKVWFKRQLQRTYDLETHRFSRNNPDPTTLTARVYEATRLPDLELSLNITEKSTESL